MKPRSRNSPRSFAGSTVENEMNQAIPQFIPQFCGIAEQAKKASKMRLARHVTRQNRARDRLKRRDLPAPGIVLFLNRVGSSSSTRDLEDLVEKGNLKLMGEKRGAHYILVSENPEESEK